MKTSSVLPVTVALARDAARVARGNRPVGTFLTGRAAQSLSLYQRYLGTIGHSASTAGARKGAKKK